MCLTVFFSSIPVVAGQIIPPDSIESIDLQRFVDGLGGDARLDESTVMDELMSVCLAKACGTSKTKMYLVSGSSFRSQPSSRPSHPLGNALGTWFNLSMSPFRHWEAFLSLKKDAFEPIYLASDSPWFLMESKRFAISYTAPRVSLVMGDFKVTHGTGAFTGNGWQPITNWSSPTRLQGSNTRFGTNVSNTTFATRRGIAGAIHVGQRVQVGLFASNVSFSASLGSKAGTASDTDVVRDISGTYAFTTESSLGRRKALRAFDYGGFINVSTSSLESSVLFERLAFSSAIEMIFPRDRIGVSGFLLKSWGPVSWMSEAALINGRAATWTAALRYVSDSMGRIKLTTHRAKAGPSWPFGSENGLTSPLLSGTELFYRTRSTDWGVLSLGFGITSTRNNAAFDAHRSIEWRIYHDWRLPKDVTVRSGFRTTTNQDQGPIAVSAVTGNPIENRPDSAKIVRNIVSQNTSTSYYQVVVSQRYSKAFSWKISPNAIWKSSASFLLVSAGAMFTSSRWSIGANWAVSSQLGGWGSRLQGYYAEPGLSGRFPVSSISGSGSGFSLLIKYSSDTSSIELKIRETARSDSETEFSYDSRLIQVQVRHGF